MALITCPECSREISDRVVSCPHCGYPIKEADETLTEIPAAESEGADLATEPTDPPDPAPGKTKRLIALLVAIVLVAGGFFCLPLAH